MPVLESDRAPAHFNHLKYFFREDLAYHLGLVLPPNADGSLLLVESRRACSLVQTHYAHYKILYFLVT